MLYDLLLGYEAYHTVTFAYLSLVSVIIRHTSLEQSCTVCRI